MVEIVLKALAMVATIGVGLLLKRVGLLRAGDARALSVLVLWVTLPCALITAFDGRELDLHLVGLSVLAIVVNLVQVGIGYAMALRQGRRAQAFAVLNSGGYNIGAFGTPYLAAMLGPQAMVPSTMFDIGGAISSAGPVYAWGTALAEAPRPGRLWRMLRVVVSSPVFMTYGVLVVLALGHVRLPGALLSFTSMAGAANPFVAMVMIGTGLELRLPHEKVLVALRLILVRLGFAVLAALAVWFTLPWERETRLIACMLLFAPLANMQVAFTATAGLDVEVSSFVASVTILVSIVVMPALLLALA